MKVLKPLMLVVAGMAIALLVSFKSQEPVKEYGSITYYISKITVHANQVKEYQVTNNKQLQLELDTIINSLSVEGWSVITEASISSGPYTGGNIIRLERTKQ